MKSFALNALPPVRVECTSGERSIASPEDVAIGRLGRTINRKWRLDSILGSGGTATVYAATHRNGNRVAIKILHPCFSNQSAERERFLREGFLCNKVDHRGVVHVLDEDVDEEDNPFLVMELLEGEPLVARWEAAAYRLPVPEALWIIERVLAVLEAAHAVGIVHRDIKPENLFLTENHELKVLDFGIARLASQGAGTLQGFVLGTPGFAAPEQSRGEWHLVDERADLWAVGATLFALLVGRLVHEHPTARTHLVRISFEPAPPARQVDPNMPEAVARLVDRALAFRREDRFASAAEMRRAVTAAYRLVTGRQMSTEPPGAESTPEVEPTLRVVSARLPSSARSPVADRPRAFAARGAVVVPRLPVAASRVPVDKSSAAIVATACFALGGLLVGHLGSGRGTNVETAQAAALVPPRPFVAINPQRSSGRTDLAAAEDASGTANAAATNVGTASAAAVNAARPNGRTPVMAVAPSPLPVAPRPIVKHPSPAPSGDNFDFMETRH